MSQESGFNQRSSNGVQLLQWLVITLFLLVAGISAWNNSRQVPQPQPERPHRPVATEVREQPNDETPVAADADNNWSKVEHQTIRDQQGRVIFEGTIDLQPTLSRIARGETNRHRNDDTVFQNREGRLPRKPAGYYKEYVNPTPGEHGPGPQRIILGRDGEIWYTPDHYRSFIPIKRPDAAREN